MRPLMLPKLGNAQLCRRIAQPRKLMPHQQQIPPPSLRTECAPQSRRIPGGWQRRQGKWMPSREQQIIRDLTTVTGKTSRPIAGPIG